MRWRRRRLAKRRKRQRHCSSYQRKLIEINSMWLRAVHQLGISAGQALNTVIAKKIEATTTWSSPHDFKAW